MEKGTYYKHYKGNNYIIINFAVHSETMEQLVIYKDVEKDHVWARPIKMFLEYVDVEGKSIPRFKKL